jgi:hypothetical protein
MDESDENNKDGNKQELNKQWFLLIQKYEKYIIQVLSLYNQLCKNRNFKMIELLSKNYGLTLEFVKDSVEYFGNLQRGEPKNAQNLKKTQKTSVNYKFYQIFLQLLQTYVTNLYPL